MSQAILDKIQYLCRKINTVEWSGALFYSYIGTIKDPKNFIITLEDILPLDKGNSGYTTYKLDNRFVDFLMEDPELRFEWKTGHIHSHHNMAVFFSGVDTAELNDNCPEHNFYLSLIVNNRNDFEAKVAFIGEATIEQRAVEFISTDEQGQPYIIGAEDFNYTERRMYVYDCKLQTPAIKLEVPNDFFSKVEDLIKPPVVVTPVKALYPANTTPAKGISTTHTAQFVGDKTTNKASFIKNFVEQFTFGHNVYMTHDDVMDAFGVGLFSKALIIYNTTLEWDLEDILAQLEDDKIPLLEIAGCVADNYADVYAEHFTEADTDNEFIYYTEELIDYISRNGIMYEEIINPTLALLRAMIKKFKDGRTTV